MTFSAPRRFCACPFFSSCSMFLPADAQTWSFTAAKLTCRHLLSEKRESLFRYFGGAAALLALMFTSGCIDLTPQSVRSGVSTSAAVPAGAASDVRSSPLYREAQDDCRAHHYLQAADVLQRLQDTFPHLSPGQAIFCRQQRALCLHDAGIPVPVAAPASVASASKPFLRSDQADCGPRALNLVCAAFHCSASLPTLRHAAGTTAKGTTLAGLAAAAGAVGLKAKGEQVDLPALRQLSGPAVAWVDGNHYVAVLAVNGDTVTIHDPNHLREEDISASTLLARSGGVLLTISR